MEDYSQVQVKNRRVEITLDEETVRFDKGSWVEITVVRPNGEAAHFTVSLQLSPSTFLTRLHPFGASRDDYEVSAVIRSRTGYDGLDWQKATVMARWMG